MVEISDQRGSFATKSEIGVPRANRDRVQVLLILCTKKRIMRDGTVFLLMDLLYGTRIRFVREV